MPNATAAGAEPVISCPKCGCDIKLTETLAGPALLQLRQAFEREKPKLIEQAKLDARRDLELELKTLHDETAAKSKLLAEAQKNELELRKERQQLQERQQAMELEVARKVDAEKAKLREQALKEFGEQQKQRDEQQRLKDAEKETVVATLRAQIDELKRKAEQGSQQLQGEVQELDLEATLRARFPRDTIEPVAKGQFGGDCLQRVLSNSGQPAGAILWESKRTKAWSDGWLAKLRDDQRAAKAEFAVLLTQVLPKSVERFGLVDGVWVADAASAFPLTVALRNSLLELAAVRQSGVGQATKMEQLYAYLTGPDFRRRVEAIVESFRGMREDLDREKTWLTKQWAKRDKEIQRALESSAGMVGDLQGIAGKALPEIQGLEPEGLEAGEGASGGASGAGPGR